MADNDDNVIDLSEASLKRLRNLLPNKNKTDEQIRQEYVAKIKARVEVDTPDKTSKSADIYDKKFKSKLQQLQKEYSIDMNDSNDKENLQNLVRQQIQLENVTRDIETIQKKDGLAADDYVKLEKLGKFQSGILGSITTLEDRLGISRRFRKEKSSDDVPQFLNELLTRGKTYFDKVTDHIKCPTCQIELAQIWLNFPKLDNDVEMALECFKCKEIIYWSKSK